MKDTSIDPNSAHPTLSLNTSVTPATPPCAPDPGGNNLQRYLVILADRFRHLEESYGYRMFEYGFYTSAYVLAANQHEAMVRACDWLADKDFRPIAVWTPELVKELLHTLETVPLNPGRPVKYGYGDHDLDDELAPDDFDVDQRTGPLALIPSQALTLAHHELPAHTVLALNLIDQLLTGGSKTAFTDTETSAGAEDFKALGNSLQRILQAAPTEEGLESWVEDLDLPFDTVLGLQEQALRAFVAELEKRGIIQIPKDPTPAGPLFNDLPDADH